MVHSSLSRYSLSAVRLLALTPAVSRERMFRTLTMPSGAEDDELPAVPNASEFISEVKSNPLLEI